MFFVETEGDRTNIMLRAAHDIVTLKLRSGASKLSSVTKCAELSWRVDEKSSQAFAVEAQAKLARVCVEACADQPLPQNLFPDTPAMTKRPQTNVSVETYDGFLVCGQTNKDEVYKFMAIVVQPWPHVHLRQLFQGYQGSSLVKRLHSLSCSCVIMKPLARGQLNTYNLVMTVEISNNTCTVRCHCILHKFVNFNAQVSETYSDGSASLTLGEIQRLTDFLFPRLVRENAEANENQNLSDNEEHVESESSDTRLGTNGSPLDPKEDESLHKDMEKMSFSKV